MLALAESLMKSEKDSDKRKSLALVVSLIEDYEEDIELSQIAKKRMGGESVRVSLEELIID